MENITTYNPPREVVFPLRQLMGMLVLICCMFPWSSPLPVASDTQPLALVVSLFYVLLFVRSIPLGYWPFVMASGAAWLLLIYEPGMNGLRGFVGYLSLLLIPLVLKDYFRHYGVPGYRLLFTVLLIWGLIGVIQFWVPDIVSFLSSRDGIYGLTAGRGSMSMAPEPTFYGIWLLLFSFSVLIISRVPGHLSRKQVTTLLLFALFQLIILSRSTLVLMILTLSVAVYLAIYFRIFLVFLMVLIAGMGLGLYYLYRLDLDGDALVENFRLLRLVISMVSSPDINLLSIDGSISDRFVQIFSSHYFFVTDYFMPHGFNSWSQASENLPEFLQGAFHSMDGLDRVLSFTGGALYEIGIFAVPMLLFMFTLAIRALPGSGVRSVIFKGFVLIVLFVQALPLALPTVSLFIALSLHISALNRARVSTT